MGVTHSQVKSSTHSSGAGRQLYSVGPSMMLAKQISIAVHVAQTSMPEPVVLSAPELPVVVPSEPELVPVSVPTELAVLLLDSALASVVDAAEVIELVVSVSVSSPAGQAASRTSENGKA